MTGDTNRGQDRLDLTITRIVDAPRALIWSAWTDPKHLVKWWAPAPWKTVDCEIDLRPGGVFRTVIRSPEGQDFPNAGCILEVVENERLVWTDALEPGYRPALKPSVGEACVPFFFTAILTLEDHGGRTRYTARALHKDEADRKTHEDMGFHDGWNQCLEQLLDLVARMK